MLHHRLRASNEHLKELKFWNESEIYENNPRSHIRFGTVTPDKQVMLAMRAKLDVTVAWVLHAELPSLCWT